MKRLRACGYIPKPTRRICVSMEFPLSRSNYNKILELLTSHIENDRSASEQVQQKQGVIPGLWWAIRPDKVINAIRQFWNKVPDGWHKSLTHGLV